MFILEFKNHAYVFLGILVKSSAGYIRYVDT